MPLTATTIEDGPAARAEVIATARAMEVSGLNVNTSGNVSLRAWRGVVEGMLITPTGTVPLQLTVADIVFMRLDDGHASGRLAPSSEWRFHRDILRSRGDVSAIVHAHSAYATALAVHGHGLPSFHYMVARGGGADIRCAPYATFGTQALSDHALAALVDRRACLLAHHGQIACGVTLAQALALAHDVEHLARIYLSARVLGEPPRLDADEMVRVLDKFEHYGKTALRVDI